eukprot:m.148536 g.148536  ORF g.148536 m.148536 type:complete len:599 (-) comp30604_c0_seq1:18-1814(-)
MEPTFLDGAIVESARKKGKLLPKIRVCGVPEHFNMAWHLGIERGIFEDNGVQVEWVTEGLGTGAMINRLKSGDVDVIVALTEGLVSEIVKEGSDVRFLGTYVGSKLTWAISSAGENSDACGKIKNIEDLRDGTIGVSRMTSGSHLMATVLASQRGWDVNKLKFEIKGNFENLRNGVNDGSTDAFMWETFTTKPYHDSSEINRVGDIQTPWPCFMLAGKKSVIDERLGDFQKMLAGVHRAARLFHTEPGMISAIANRYHLKLEDAAKWFSGVHIAAERFVSESSLDEVLVVLKATGVISADNKITPADMIDTRLAELKRDIKNMTVYQKSSRITALHCRLKAAGVSTGPVSYEQLSRYDQTIYFGTKAVDKLVKNINITKDSRVINVGSGLGGAARYLAGSVGCQVLANELQNDLHMTSLELTNRAKLSDKVHHMCGDFLTVSQHLQTDAYDMVVSWLTVLHFDNRAEFFKQAYTALKPGGIFFAADFFARGELTKAELLALKNEVSCPLPHSIEIYKSELEGAGFKVMEDLTQDVTDEYKEFTAKRVEKFETHRAVLEERYGGDVYKNLHNFYVLVRDLYKNGNLGGVEIYARKPLGW